MAESITNDCETRDRQVTVYFPSDILRSGTNGFLYGITKPCEADNSCSICIYVTFVSKEIRNENSRWQTLLGTYNSKTDCIPKSHVWLEFEEKERTLKKLSLGGVQVPVHNVLLIMYDQSLLQSELLDHNVNWTKSGSLQGLKLALKEPQDKKEEFQPEFFHCGTVSLSKVIHQLQYRYYQWRVLRKAKTKTEHHNLLLTIISDFVLGLFFLLIFHSVGGPSYIIQSFSTSFKIVADNLQELVEWLNGVPVGLKLNRQFSTVLARFFLYHLYLWKTYIDIITLVLSAVFTVLMCISILGLSFQVALFSDMIKLASLHAYCFYVYAARLYGVALQGLLSTLRMFKGSKWNPLRQRVDSGHFSWDQQCIGMFIASSLLLLLPTILVYYIVFLLLRVVILMVQGLLERLIWLLNSIPICSFMLWLFNSPTIAGDVYFEVLTPGADEANGPVALKLLGIKLSLTETLRLSVNERTTAEWPTTNWFQTLTSIVTGELIYPM